MTMQDDAMAVMAAYDYPGNVRELRNLVERLAILCEGPTISRAEVEDVLPRSRNTTANPPGVAMPQVVSQPAASPAAEPIAAILGNGHGHGGGVAAGSGSS